MITEKVNNKHMFFPALSNGSKHHVLKKRLTASHEGNGRSMAEVVQTLHAFWVASP